MKTILLRQGRATIFRGHLKTFSVHNIQWLLGVETLRGWIQSIVKPDLSVLKKVNVLPPQYSTRKTEKAVIFRFIDSRYCYSFHILQPHTLTKRK